ncbi:hypothetical protein EDD21DRAFT_361411 [Dissophora ornata]|nr:hypothetical protein EDD21DRAFT_361411 [Dissophora ornata]
MTSVKDQAKALNINLSGRTNLKEDKTLLIRGTKDVKQDLIEVQGLTAVHLLECENCEYTIRGKLVKLSIEKCKNVVLKIEDKVVTGIVDAWKSENISLDFDRSVAMFQLEAIKTIVIHLPDAEHFGSMVWAGVNGLKLHLGQDTHLLSFLDMQSRNPSLNAETNQFKTTIVDGSIMTEAIVRLEGGHVATRAEEASIRELEKRKEDALRAPLDE